jgi:hypothetical protein
VKRPFPCVKRPYPRHRSVSSKPMINTGMPIIKSGPAQSAMPTTMSEKPTTRPARRPSKPMTQIRTRNGSVMRYQKAAKMPIMDGISQPDAVHAGARRSRGVYAGYKRASEDPPAVFLRFRDGRIVTD